MHAEHCCHPTGTGTGTDREHGSSQRARGAATQHQSGGQHLSYCQNAALYYFSSTCTVTTWLKGLIALIRGVAHGMTVQQLEARLSDSEDELAGLRAAASKHAEMIAMIHSTLSLLRLRLCQPSQMSNVASDLSGAR